MWQNKLLGDIPSEIGKLNNLQDLNLAESSFFGNIPSSLGNLTMLGRQHPSNSRQVPKFVSFESC